jgi:hypothetical protein
VPYQQIPRMRGRAGHVMAQVEAVSGDHSCAYERHQHFRLNFSQSKMKTFIVSCTYTVPQMRKLLATVGLALNPSKSTATASTPAPEIELFWKSLLSQPQGLKTCAEISALCLPWSNGTELFFFSIKLRSNTIPSTLTW